MATARRSADVGSEDASAREIVVAGLRRLGPMARANLALITDAGETLAAVFAARRPVATTYDGRARLRQGLRSPAAVRQL